MQQMSEMGTNIIKKSKTIMEWNRLFRTKELFPYLNIYIEMGEVWRTFVLETFSEVKIQLSKWAKQMHQGLVVILCQFIYKRQLFLKHIRLTWMIVVILKTNLPWMNSLNVLVWNTYPTQQYAVGWGLWVLSIVIEKNVFATGTWMYQM